MNCSFICVCLSVSKSRRGPSKHGKKDFKNPNSETSSRIFLNFSLLPTDFQEISGFSKKILGPEQVKKNVNLFRWSAVEFFFSCADMQKTHTDRIYFLISKIPEWFFFSVQYCCYHPNYYKELTQCCYSLAIYVSDPYSCEMSFTVYLSAQMLSAQLLQRTLPNVATVWLCIYQLISAKSQLTLVLVAPCSLLHCFTVR